MKKKILIACIVSVVINLILFGVNLVGANVFHSVPFAKSIPGGECIEYIGFGVYLLEIFPMTADGGVSVSYQIGFHFMSLLIPLIVIFLLTFGILLLIDKLRGKKNV